MSAVKYLKNRLALFMNSAGVALVRASRQMGSAGFQGYDVIEHNKYDCLPKGECIFGAKSQFLLVPKNRYRVVLLPGQEINQSLGVGWITEDNSPQGYDKLWGQADKLHAYRSEADGIRKILTREIVDQIEAELDEGGNIVDIGCGVGDLLLEIRSRRCDVSVSGLDFSEKAVQNAKKKFTDGNFQQFVIEKNLPYESGVFNTVLCTDVIEHLQYPETIIQELVRICRPGGFVVIVVPNGDEDQFLGHYWFWNMTSLRKLLEKWNANVMALPITGELLAKIHVPLEG